MKRPSAAPPEEVVLEGFGLRRYQRSDAPAMAMAIAESLEHLRPYMPWIAGEPLSLEEREALIERWNRAWAEGTEYSYGMFRGDRVVGGAGLMRRIAPGGLEIGYWVHPDFVGRGSRDPCGASPHHGRTRVCAAVTHVEIHHDKANIASGRVPLKLGFKMVGEVQVEIAAPGHTGLDCVWRVDRARWAARIRADAPER